MLIKIGSIYQERIPEINRTLVEYKKSDGSEYCKIFDETFTKYKEENKL
jgi:hypothetical protein